MTEQKPYERNLRWILLLALLINLLLLLLLFITDFNTEWLFHTPFEEHHAAPVVFDEMPPPEELPKNPEEIAALKPRASQFGATELLQEEPEFTPGFFDQLIPEQKGADQEEQEKQPETEPLPESSEPSPQEKKEESTKAEFIPQPTEKKELPPPKEEVKPQQHQQPAEKKEVGVPKKASTRSTPGSQEKIASPIEKKLTFNDLANGFLASWQDEGNDFLERKGNENIRPGFEEMKYISYLNKIGWYMQNAWHRQPRVVLNAAPDGVVVTGIRMTLNKEGYLQNVQLLESCGFNQLDEMVLNGIKDASPYPPLPDHFKKDIMTFDFGVKHWGQPNFMFNMGGR